MKVCTAEIQPSSNTGLSLEKASKPSFPMIVPHAARFDAAERQVVLDDVQDRFIDRDAAGAGVRNQETARRGVAGEGIKGKGPVTSIDRVYRFLRLAIGQDRQDGPEDLAPHQLHLARYV